MDIASVCWAVRTEISIIIRRISGIKRSESQNSPSVTQSMFHHYLFTFSQWFFNWHLNKNSLWLYCITHVSSTAKCLRVRVDKLHEPGAICYPDNQLHLSISTSVPPLDTQQCTAMIRRSTSKCQTAISKSSCTLVKYIPKLKCSFGHSKMSQIRCN